MAFVKGIGVFTEGIGRQGNTNRDKPTRKACHLSFGNHE